VTVKEAALIYAEGMGMPRLVGTPADIADQLEHFIDAGGADGFLLVATYAPGCFEAFVDLVVPELQRRGRYRTAYNGEALRENLLEYWGAQEILAPRPRKSRSVDRPQPAMQALGSMTTEDAMPRALLSSFRVGILDLRNRVAMAPMTRNRAGAGELATPMMATYYGQRAGAGLIVTEASQISPEAVGYPKTPGIHTDNQVEAWRQVTDAVHDAGGRIFLQLWHAGRASHPSLLPERRLPVAPSAIAAAGKAFTAQGLLPFPKPRALALAEIAPIVAAFGHASVRARAAGFDGVEIHAGNGYLIDQFLRDGTNQRTDRYGGSPANRTRFLLEVVEAAAAAWEANRVGVRVSPLQTFNDMRDSDPAATFAHVAKELSSFDLAYLHLVESIDPAAGSLGLVISPLVRTRFDGPLMLNGGYTRDLANFTILDGLADLVSFGSAYIANPDLTERFRHHHPLNTPDRATFYGGTAEGYIDYPAMGEEQTLLRA